MMKHVATFLMAFVISARVAAATPLTYTFVGTMSPEAKLVEANGLVIDLANHAVTITGTSDTDAIAFAGSPFLNALSTYDFGTAGSFTTADMFEPFDGQVLGLRSFIPGAVDVNGFIFFATNLDGDGIFGHFVNRDSNMFTDSEGRFITDAAGDTLSWSAGGPINLLMASATVEPVPEPSTVMVLGTGLIVVLAVRLRRASHEATFTRRR